MLSNDHEFRMALAREHVDRLRRSAREGRTERKLPSARPAHTLKRTFRTSPSWTT
jgi:hypothetical protein